MIFKVTSNFSVQQLTRNFRKAISRGVKNFTPKFVKKTKRGITTGTRTGREYVKRGGRRHRASARGETIASDTGNTSRNIVTKNLGDFHSAVIVQTDYAEYSIKDGREIFPELAETEKEFTEDLQKEIAKVL